MEQKQSISPELNELLKTVKFQAGQYNQAFQILNKRISEFDSTKIEINSHSAHFKKELSDILTTLNTSYKEKESSLVKCINQANALTGELQSLKALQDNVRAGILELSDLMENHKNELDQMKQTSSEFAKTAYLQLDDTLEYLKQKVNSSLEKESQVIEDRVNNRIQYLEDNLKKGDKILNSRHEKLQNEIKLVKREIQAIKEISGMDNSDKSLTSTLNLRFEDVEDNIAELKQIMEAVMQNIAVINASHSSLQSENTVEAESDHTSDTNNQQHEEEKTDSVEVIELKKTLDKYASTIQEFNYLKQKSLSSEKRSGISMILSVFAILSILMILFLFLI